MKNFSKLLNLYVEGEEDKNPLDEFMSKRKKKCKNCGKMVEYDQFGLTVDKNVMKVLKKAGKIISKAGSDLLDLAPEAFKK